MRYTAMIIGFVLATVTAVGAAEPDGASGVAFGLGDLAKAETPFTQGFDCVCAGTAQTLAQFAD